MYRDCFSEQYLYFRVHYFVLCDFFWSLTFILNWLNMFLCLKCQFSRSTNKTIISSFGVFCLGFIVYSKIYMETSSLPVKGCKFWPMLCTHRHCASVYNNHLREFMTLTPIAGRLAVELSLPIFTTKICRGWDSNTTCACGANALTHCAIAAVNNHMKN